MLPVIAITPGEPAGIGPDLAIRTALKPFPCRRIYFADPELLKQRAQQLAIDIDIRTLSSLDTIPDAQAGVMQVWPVKLATEVVAGKLDSRNATYVLDSIRMAVESQQHNLRRPLHW